MAKGPGPVSGTVARGLERQEMQVVNAARPEPLVQWQELLC